MNLANSWRSGPDPAGHFGAYGGRFVAETLMPLVLALEEAWTAAKSDPRFKAELEDLSRHYVGRPSPLYFAERLTEHLRGPKVYLKREDLNHTGAHKINNCLGQILLARRMGKTRISAATVAVATPCWPALRSAVRRLHGRDRHGTAEAERVSDAPFGRGSSRSHFRIENAKRCDE